MAPHSRRDFDDVDMMGEKREVITVHVLNSDAKVLVKAVVLHSILLHYMSKTNPTLTTLG